MLNDHAFQEEGSYKGGNRRRAMEASYRMRYALIVSLVEFGERVDDANTGNVAVAVEQVVVAPFYYSLSLVLTCSDLSHGPSLA